MRTLALPLEPDEFQAGLDMLRFDYHKWDIFHRGQTNVLPDVLVLSQAEHEQLVDIATETWQALRELEAQVVADPALLKAVGVPDEVAAMIQYDRGQNPRLSRCDFHLTAQGRWVITEFNEDGPGGLIEGAGIEAVLASQWAERLDGLTCVGELPKAICGALAEWPRIGLVHATAYTEDLQSISLVARWLEAAGHHAVMGSPANLVFEDGQAMMFGEPVDALFRYYPGEWLGELPNAKCWRQAAESLPMMNGLGALAAQSKRFYAVPVEHDIDLSDSARLAIDSHLPQTRYLRPEMGDQLVAEQADWVIKGIFGRMGDSVRAGVAFRPEKWHAKVEDALAEADQHAVQQRFDSPPLWFSNGLGYANIGLFLVDGRFAGYYSRVSPYPLIDYDSAHVATMVEVS